MNEPMTLRDWEAGIEERRRIGNLVAPACTRRKEGSDDKRLRKEFGGERAPGRPQHGGAR